MPSNVPFYSLEAQHRLIKDEITNAFGSVFEGNQFILGKSLLDFENRYAAFCGTHHCVGVGNGLDAIALSLRALGIGPGHEVIVPAHTFIATWHAVTLVGATPVPIEPDLKTFNIDVDRIEPAITARTKAIVPVHLYGQSCDMTSILRLARKYKLVVVEDNAQSQGAMFDGMRTGSMGHCSATSFYPVKNLGSLGDGGAITTSDGDLSEKLRQLRNYGSLSRSVYDLVSGNSRLDELQAAILSVKLKYLEQWNRERQEIASAYKNSLMGIDDLILPTQHPSSTHVFHLFVIRTPRRNDLAAFLEKKGIGTTVHYPVPAHLQPAYTALGYQRGAFPLTEEIADTCLSLPIWPGMQQDQISCVTEAVRSFFR
jgi:dTDP-4-amino-4,6-dideoxygalactose transaminase